MYTIQLAISKRKCLNLFSTLVEGVVEEDVFVVFFFCFGSVCVLISTAGILLV